MKIKKVLYPPSRIKPLIYQQHLQTQQRPVYYGHNIHLGSTPRTRIHNTNIRRWFQRWDLAVRRMTPGSMNNRFGSRFLFWLSSVTKPRIKVRVFIIWRDRILELVIWIRSTGLVMCPGFYCGSQGAHHLGCSLDNCRVHKAQRLYQGPLHLLLSLWRRTRRLTPKAAAATVFYFVVAALVVTHSPPIFIEANTISTLSGGLSSFVKFSRAGWQVAVCVHIYIFYRTLSSQSTWPDISRGRSCLVLLGVILIWHLALLISLCGFLKMPANTSCTLKKLFWQQCLKKLWVIALSQKRHLGNFFSYVHFLYEELVGGFWKYGLIINFSYSKDP